MQVTIVGLDLIGLSMALGLKQMVPGIVIVGHDPEASRVKRAAKLKAIDRSHWNLGLACEGAQLIVLNIPLDEIERTLLALGDQLEKHAVILELSPVKNPVFTWAQAHLGENLALIGGHPILPLLNVQSEPSAELFHNATFCLISGPGADEDSMALASDVVTALGARPYFVDVEEHDGMMAATSHLPRLASYAVFLTLATARDQQGCADLTGMELATLGALIESKGTLTPEALYANAENIRLWLVALDEMLNRIRRALDADSEKELAAICQETTALLERWWHTDRQTKRPPSTWQTFWLGRWGQSRDGSGGER